MTEEENKKMEENKSEEEIHPKEEEVKAEETKSAISPEGEEPQPAKAEEVKVPDEAPVPEVIEEEIKEEEPAISPEGKKAEEKKADKKWYVLQTYSGQEDQVKSSIERNIEQMGMKEKISRILVPEEETVEVRGQKKIEKKRKMFPGYVFIEMMLDDESWYAIRQAPGVARFIGTKVKPTPVSDREMQRVLKQIGIKKEKLEVAFEKGEIVRVISGPFRGYTGVVDEINAEKGKLKVLISIFGRDTPVEVNFEHAEKIV
ncbi:MAG: transcription termination/antitermination protein NusG [Candidatus Margulisiibacteriota bacterium]